MTSLCTTLPLICQMAIALQYDADESVCCVVIFCIVVCSSAFFITAVVLLSLVSPCFNVCSLSLCGCLYVPVWVMFFFVYVLMSTFVFFLLFSGPTCGLSFSAPPPPLPFFQVRTLASAGGPDNLVMLDPGKYKSRPQVPEPAGDGSSTHPKWQIGEQEFEALMRMLDNLVGTKTRR